MNFGVVDRYVSERGFGFIRSLLGENKNEDVFFHISTIKRTALGIAEKIIKSPSERVWLWFDVEETPKGYQVGRVFTSEQVQAGAIKDPSCLISDIERLWGDGNYQKTEWLEHVTTDLMGKSRLAELVLMRNRQEDERRERQEAIKRKAEAHAAKIELEIKEIQAQQARWDEAERLKKEKENNEFEALVEEMQKFGFKESRDVSRYIVNNQLGLKYRNISGVVIMGQAGDHWKFNGGFPPDIYKKLCWRLGLVGRGSQAKVISFESYDSIDKRSGGVELHRKT